MSENPEPVTGPSDIRVEPLRSVHTSNLPEILEQLGISLVVTTYQAGRLVVLRSQGGTLNTHFRCFDKPMGLAVTREPAGDRGGDQHLGVPQSSRRLPKAGRIR